MIFHTQGSYSIQRWLGDLEGLMNGMLNIYPLRHISMQIDCTMNLLR